MPKVKSHIYCMYKQRGGISGCRLMLLGWNRLDTNPGHGNGAKGHRVTWPSDNKDGLICLLFNFLLSHISSWVWIVIYGAVKREGGKCGGVCMTRMEKHACSLSKTGSVFNRGSLSPQCRAHSHTSMAADLLRACPLAPTWLPITCWQAHVILSRCCCVVSEL